MPSSEPRACGRATNVPQPDDDVLGRSPRYFDKLYRAMWPMVLRVSEIGGNGLFMIRSCLSDFFCSSAIRMRSSSRFCLICSCTPCMRCLQNNVRQNIMHRGVKLDAVVCRRSRNQETEGAGPYGGGKVSVPPPYPRWLARVFYIVPKSMLRSLDGRVINNSLIAEMTVFV